MGLPTGSVSSRPALLAAVALLHLRPRLLELLVRHKGGVGPATERGVGQWINRRLVDRPSVPGNTASMSKTCDSHGCSTLNGPPAALGPISDRVCADRWGPVAWVEVLREWGGVSVDRRLGEVQGWV